MIDWREMEEVHGLTQHGICEAEKGGFSSTTAVLSPIWLWGLNLLLRAVISYYLLQ